MTLSTLWKTKEFCTIDQQQARIGFRALTHAPGRNGSGKGTVREAIDGHKEPSARRQNPEIDEQKNVDEVAEVEEEVVIGELPVIASETLSDLSM